jgi:hypothetical protein
MKRTALLAIGLLMVSTSATAGPNWTSIGLNISLQDAPKVQAALDDLMKSTGSGLTGNVSLMANVAGGATSHSIISSFDSRAAREAWLTKMRASKAWAKYVKTTAGMTSPGETSRMDFVDDWGTDNADATVLWEMHAFTVTDPGAFLAALEALQASDAGKAAGAQVYLSAVGAAGLAPATHVISVGYKSEAHAEASSAALNETEAWATYLEASGEAGTFEGTFVLQTVSTWGDDN